jgi:hypothetical protein
VDFGEARVGEPTPYHSLAYFDNGYWFGIDAMKNARGSFLDYLSKGLNKAVQYRYRIQPTSYESKLSYFR